MDFLLVLLPWIILWNLNMKRKEKITVCISLSLGIFAGACGVIRTAGLDVLSQTTDYLYATSNPVMWTFSEVTTTLICVCIPTIRPFWTYLTDGSSSGGYYEPTDPASKGSLNYNLKCLPHTSSHTNTDVQIGRGLDKADADSDKSILIHGHAIRRVQEISVTCEDVESNASTRNDVSGPAR